MYTRQRVGIGFALVPMMCAALLPALTAYALDAPYFWARQFGSETFGTDQGTAVAADSSGNVWVTGSFVGTADFGGGPLTSAGNEDIFLAQYDVQGNYLGSQRFGSTGTDRGLGVAVDSHGNVWITGQFVGSVDFGGGVITGVSGSNCFLAKFNPDGSHALSFGLGTTAAGNALAVDGQDNVWLAGWRLGLLSQDTIIAKYGPSGAQLFFRPNSLNTSDADQALGITTDASGNALLTGVFTGSINLGGANLTSSGGEDIFVAKYGPTGVHQWSQRFGGASSDRGNSAVTDAAGNVIVVGLVGASGVDFGGGPLSAAGEFVAKFDGAGMHSWSLIAGTGGASMNNAATADGVGGVIVLGNGVSRFDGAGTFLYSYPIGVWGIGCARDPYDNVVVTGSFGSQWDFGGGPVTPLGPRDGFVAKYGPRYLPAISAIVDVGNDQGRYVRISFQRAGFDNVGNPDPITGYEVYRRSDVVNGAASQADARSHKAVATRSQAEKLAGWENVGSVAPHGETDYVTIASTLADSTIAHGMFYSAFFIRAATANPFRFYDSPVDSGYSLDNLAPGVPSGLAYSGGQLSWSPSSAPDFDYFTVYGSASPSFGANAVVVNYTTGNALNVSDNPYAHYFLTATDFAGNESLPASLAVATGVDQTRRGYVLSLFNYPNPFNPSTTLRFTVPAGGRVVVNIYDARGARVTTLLDEARSAGAYSVVWNGRDDAGAPVASGAYLARIEQAGASYERRLVLLK